LRCGEGEKSVDTRRLERMAATTVCIPDARDRHALSYLRPGLQYALATGRPAIVGGIHSSLRNPELVALARDLCESEGANVAVLGNRRANTVTFAPLL
jgi:hypothetical protein